MTEIGRAKTSSKNSQVFVKSVWWNSIMENYHKVSSDLKSVSRYLLPYN